MQSSAVTRLSRQALFSHIKSATGLIFCRAGIQNWKVPEEKFVEFPPGDKKRLKMLEKTPAPPPGQRPPKMFRRLIDMRGPEEVHNTLLHKQYGIQALGGGNLKWGHLEMLRLTIIRKMDESRMFSIWRIDSPWKPLTKKGQGHRMGGGKGAIDEYVVPIKAGRIILEVGGHCEFNEAEFFLRRMAHNLPFAARAVSQEMLDKEKLEEARLDASNMNPFTFKYCLENNFMGSRIWASPYDYKWHNKYK